MCRCDIKGTTFTVVYPGASLRTEKLSVNRNKNWEVVDAFREEGTVLYQGEQKFKSRPLVWVEEAGRIAQNPRQRKDDTKELRKEKRIQNAKEAGNRSKREIPSVRRTSVNTTNPKRSEREPRNRDLPGNASELFPVSSTPYSWLRLNAEQRNRVDTETVSLDEDVVTYLIAENRNRGAKPGAAHFDPSSTTRSAFTPNEPNHFSSNASRRRRSDLRSHKTKVHSEFSNINNIFSRGTEELPHREKKDYW